MEVNLDIKHPRLPKEFKSALMRNPPYGNQQNFLEAYDNAYTAKGNSAATEFPFSWFVWWFVKNGISKVSITLKKKITNFKVVGDKLTYGRNKIEITTFAKLNLKIRYGTNIVKKFTEVDEGRKDAIKIPKIIEYFRKFKAELRYDPYYSIKPNNKGLISKAKAEFAIEPLILSHHLKGYDDIMEVIGDLPHYIRSLLNKMIKYTFTEISNDLIELLGGWIYDSNQLYSYIVDSIHIKFRVIDGKIPYFDDDEYNTYTLVLPILKIKYYAVNVGEFERNILPHLDMLNGYKSGRWSDEDLIKYAADNWDIHEKDIDTIIHKLDSLINSPAILEKQ